MMKSSLGLWGRLCRG